MENSLLILVTCIALISCPDSPTDVAKKYTECLMKGDFKGAANYADPDRKEKLEYGYSYDEITMAILWLSSYDNYKFKALEEKINGNSAQVKYIDINGEEGIIDLVKINNEWKVTVVIRK